MSRLHLLLAATSIALLEAWLASIAPTVRVALADRSQPVLVLADARAAAVLRDAEKAERRACRALGLAPGDACAAR